MKTLFAASILATAWLLHASAASAQCNNNFSDSFALSNVLAQARDTFADKTTRDASGKLAFCKDPDNDKWSICWDYRQRCGGFQSDGAPAYLNTWPWPSGHKPDGTLTGYQHYHLTFLNRAFEGGNCFCNPGDGYGSGFGLQSLNTCVSFSPDCPDWTLYGRSLIPHDTQGWLLVYMEKRGDGVKHVFTMPSVTLGPGDPMQLWFVRASDNTTWGWSNLAPNCGPGATCADRTYNLNIPESTEVWISTSTTNTHGQVNIKGYTATAVR